MKRERWLQVMLEANKVCFFFKVRFCFVFWVTLLTPHEKDHGFAWHKRMWVLSVWIQSHSAEWRNCSTIVFLFFFYFFQPAGWIHCVHTLNLGNMHCFFGFPLFFSFFSFNNVLLLCCFFFWNSAEFPFPLSGICLSHSLVTKAFYCLLFPK